MIVITGGAGFIGSNLLAALESGNGPGIAVIDRLGTGEKWRNIAKRELLAIVPPERMFEYLAAHRSSIETLFHLGAISSTTENDADLIVEQNFTTSQRLWRWCADHRVNLIYASSAATYGAGAGGFSDESTSLALAKLKPLNAYGWSKHLFDRWAVRQAERGYPSPPQWAGLKFFNVYGANEYHKAGQHSVAYQVFRKAAAGEAATLFRSHHPDYADGGQLRDFISVDDAVDMMLWLHAHPKVSGLFNAGTGTARSFLDLANAVFAALGKPADIAYVDTPEALRPKYQYFTEAKMDRLRAAGYAGVPTSLEAGIKQYVSQYLSAEDPYR